MASASVRFHPAAAQEAESTYGWYAARSPETAHGFRKDSLVYILRGEDIEVVAHGRRRPGYCNCTRLVRVLVLPVAPLHAVVRRHAYPSSWASPMRIPSGPRM